MEKKTTSSGRSLLGRLYDWVLGLSASRHAVWVLGGVSFAESSCFPIPPDIILISMCLARPKRSFHYAFWCTVTSVLGGLLGYALGFYLFASLVHPFMAAIGLSGAWFGDPADGIRVLAGNVDQMVSLNIIGANAQESLRQFLTSIDSQLNSYEIYTNGLFFKGIVFFNNYGVLTVFVAAFTILPYKLFTISAGVFGQPLLGFVLSSIAGRGLRFFLVAALLYFFGPKIEPLIRKHLELLVIVFTLLLIIGILMLKML